MPTSKLLAHEPSGCELRAFGMEFGQTTGCDDPKLQPAIANCTSRLASRADWCGCGCVLHVSLALWPAATVTAESFLEASVSGAWASKIRGRSVLELGAGLSLPSIVAAKVGHPRLVVSRCAALI
eukprot:COSAG02_NODE_3451_length_6715_cov_7.265146_8_plen_125_part_00